MLWDELRLEVSERLNRFRIVRWLAPYQKVISYVGLIGLIAGSWMTIKLMHSGDSFQEVAVAFEKWKASPSDSELLDRFCKVVTHSPRAQKQFSQEAVQLLLTEGKSNEALSMAQFQLDGLRRLSSQHAEFSEISFLIMQKKYQEALERSVSLKETLQDNSCLARDNCLRIAILQRMLNNDAGELAAWRDWDAVKPLKQDPVAVNRPPRGDDFTISLQTYATYRKAELIRAIPD